MYLRTLVNFSDPPNSLFAHLITAQPEGGKSMVSRYGGFWRLIIDEGASVTDSNGKSPSPDPRNQNLWPCRCIGWPIYKMISREPEIAMTLSRTDWRTYRVHRIIRDLHNNINGSVGRGKKCSGCIPAVRDATIDNRPSRLYEWFPVSHPSHYVCLVDCKMSSNVGRPGWCRVAHEWSKGLVVKLDSPRCGGSVDEHPRRDHATHHSHVSIVGHILEELVI